MVIAPASAVDIREVPVDILLPRHVSRGPFGLLRKKEPTRYRLQVDMIIGGHHIPAGFITDGASVPQFLWGMFPPVDNYLPAAIVHDYMLVMGYPWSEANAMFDRILKELNVATWRRGAMGISTKAYGWTRSTFHGEPA